MEVVLSPGRFGDEVPGAPFQNEEVREWSHVDRLTGMLERARVETGRWKTLNQGSARSYGKVIDSRERNSADGSVVQRARRQVEVFQSEGPGRSVQIVRASQWSSSRVTDSSTTGPLGLTSLAQNKNDAATPDRLLASSRVNKLSPSSSLCHDEAISERLSTLLGSFASHASSSTVPLRRIDSKYASRTPISQKISKRSNSNEDLASHTYIHGTGGHLVPTISSRDLNGRGCQLIKDKSNVLQRIHDCRKNSFDDARQKIYEINVEPEESINCNEKPKWGENRGTIDDSAIAFNIDEVRAVTSKAAIQLLPSNKANKTFVNLINDSDNCQGEATDIEDGKRGDMLSWPLPGSIIADEATVPISDETTTTSTTTTTTSTTTPRRDSRLEESTMAIPSGRSVKRVGFCKTEIHFAADSGKVNIVETDGKPPPTNKFRRRRRNSLTGASSGRNVAIDKIAKVETKNSLEERTVEDNKARTDPNLHRGHTTTVNLGSDLSLRNERINRENQAPSESIGESSVNDKICSTYLASGNIDDLMNKDSKDVCDVVCTDADNNQVFLKIVKVHEPTIATVESDNLRKKMRPSNKIPASVKTERRLKKCSVPATRKTESHKEHTYVNVFTGSKCMPIYENYKIGDPIPVADGKIVVKSSADADSVKEKNAYVAEGKSQGSQSSSCSVLKPVAVDDTKLERVKNVVGASVDVKLFNGKELHRHGENGSEIGIKKARNKTKESKTYRTAGLSGHTTSSPSTTSSRDRSGKHLEIKSTPKSSVSSNDRAGRVNAVNTVACANNSTASKSMESAASARTTTNKSDRLTKQKPVEVVYQTAVYNMKNEKLKKPQKGKESKGPRYLNELICGAKIKRSSDSKHSKSSSATQHAANNKSASHPIKHWK